MESLAASLESARTLEASADHHARIIVQNVMQQYKHSLKIFHADVQVHLLQAAALAHLMSQDESVTSRWTGSQLVERVRAWVWRALIMLKDEGHFSGVPQEYCFEY